MIQQQQLNFIEKPEIAQYNFNKIKKIWNQTQRNNKRKQKYKKFILRNCKMDIIPSQAIQLIQTAKQLRMVRQLDLSQMGLRYLSYRQKLRLPLLQTLIKLDLTFNFISDDQVKYILECKNLEVLYLTQNNIRKFMTIKQLVKLERLYELDITQNPLQYRRDTVFDAIPHLNILNRLSKNLVDLDRNRMFDVDNQQQAEQGESVQDEDEDQMGMEDQQYSLPQQDNIVFDGNQEKSFHLSELPQSVQESQQDDQDEESEEDSESEEKLKQKKQMQTKKPQESQPLNLLSSLNGNTNQIGNQHNQQNIKQNKE